MVLVLPSVREGVATNETDPALIPMTKGFRLEASEASLIPSAVDVSKEVKI